MQVEIALRQFLVDNAVIPNASQAGKIEYSKIVQKASTPFIWIERSSLDAQVDCAGEPLITTTTFDLEVIDDNPDTAQSYADTIRALLNGYQGDFGGVWALSVFCVDQQDDYQPNNLDSDDGRFVAALSVEIAT